MQQEQFSAYSELFGEVSYQCYLQWLRNQTLESYDLFVESIPRQNSLGHPLNKTLFHILHCAREDAKQQRRNDNPVSRSMFVHFRLYNQVYDFFIAQQQQDNKLDVSEQ